MQKITDPVKIRQVLRDYMFHPAQQTAPFFVEIRVAPGSDWNGWKVPGGGLIIEGARPMSCVTHGDSGDQVFSLTNSDSHYQRCIGQVRLADIEFVQTLH